MTDFSRHHHFAGERPATSDGRRVSKRRLIEEERNDEARREAADALARHDALRATFLDYYLSHPHDPL